MKKKNLLQENMGRFKTKNLNHINEHVLGELPSQKLMKMKWNPLTEAVDMNLLKQEVNSLLPKFDDWSAIETTDPNALDIMRGDELMGSIKQPVQGVGAVPVETDLLIVRVTKNWDSVRGMQKYDPTLTGTKDEILNWIRTQGWGTAVPLPKSDNQGTGEEIYDKEQSGGFCKRNLDIDWYFNMLVSGKSYLRLGDCGVAVEVAQEHANEFITGNFVDARNIGPLDVDGKYGPLTKKEISRVQDFLNLRPDGLFGKKTHEALLKAIKSGESAQVQIDPIQPDTVSQQPSLRTLAPVTPVDQQDMKQKAVKGAERRRKNRLKRLQSRQGKLKKKLDKLV